MCVYYVVVESPPYALHACLLATWGLEILLNASLAAGVDAVLVGAAPLLVADLGAAYDATAADTAAVAGIGMNSFLIGYNVLSVSGVRSQNTSLLCLDLDYLFWLD